MRSSEPFNHFVDDYLAYLHEVHPTSATLDGVHTHDDLLEDLSRHGIEQDTRALAVDGCPQLCRDEFASLRAGEILALAERWRPV